MGDLPAEVGAEPESRKPDGANLWPAWFAPTGFLLGLFGGGLLVGTTLLLASAVGDSDSPAARILGTLIQDGWFVAAAVLLASIVARPQSAQFGLRPATRSVALPLIVAAASYYVFALTYGALVSVQGKQDTLDALGADDGLGLLIASGTLVVLIAPYAEEIFFRGFIYRASRNRLAILPAVLMNGALFGAVHYDGSDTLVLIPVLAVLGAVFCLLYERTGSLYPAIALHALNNAIAFAGTASSSAAPTVAASLLAVSLTICWLGLRQPSAPPTQASAA